MGYIAGVGALDGTEMIFAKGMGWEFPVPVPAGGTCTRGTNGCGCPEWGPWKAMDSPKRCCFSRVSNVPAICRQYLDQHAFGSDLHQDAAGRCQGAALSSSPGARAGRMTEMRWKSIATKRIGSLGALVYYLCIQPLISTGDHADTQS